MTKRIFLLLFAVLICATNIEAQKKAPLRIAVIGLTHTHVHWIFNSEKRGDIKIVGILESNRGLAERYAEEHGFSMTMVYPSNEDLLKETQPEAVAAFGNIYDHLSVVETFAPLGVHVMVEKPLAVSLEHAMKMAALAKEHDIFLLTNYETTWYPTNHKAYELFKQDAGVGDLRKVIVRDGHKGPKKIGINQEFLEWLTDPELNGGGALMDFGCYGANLMTWFMEGEQPLSVTAITHQLQKENNPRVDDEAVLLLKYKEAVAIVQASWNWPIGRKDLEIYGLKGAIYADDRNNLRLRMATGYDTFTEEAYKLEERPAPYDDPFSYLAALIRNEITMPPHDLSSIENNVVVMKILDAAHQSATLGKTILLE